MRLTIAAFGLELDLTFGPATEDAEDAAPASSMDGGTTASTGVGFTTRYDVPPEYQAPDRLLPWDPEDE